MAQMKSLKAAFLVALALPASGAAVATGKGASAPLIGHRLDELSDPVRHWSLDGADPVAGKPIFIDRWYPAARTTRRTRLRDYVVRTARGDADRAILTRYVNPRDQAIVERGLAGGDAARAPAFYNLPMQAWEGARPAAASRGSVVMVSDWTLSAQPNALLGEALAGQGFTVASPLTLGRDSASTTFSRGSLADAEDQARDVEFALQSAPSAHNVTLVAHGEGAVAALVVASRHPEVTSLVLLNPPRTLQDGPASLLVDPYDVRARILVIAPAGVETGRWERWMPYAGLEVVQVAATPPDWTDFAALSAGPGSRVSVGYSAILDALLTHLVGAGPGRPAPAFRRDPPPIPRELGWLTALRREEFDTVRARLLSLRSAYPDLKPFRQKEMLRVTRDRTSGKWDLDAAIGALRLNAIAYPDAISSFDSLADAYLEAGRRADAAATYREELKALERDPALNAKQRQEEADYLNKRLAELAPG